MIYLLSFFTLAAILLHVFIFYLETIAWESFFARKTFELSEEEAKQTKAMAANQGVYNLLLAVTALIGLGLYFCERESIGLALVIAGCGSMVVAAVYLFLSSDKKQAAAKQLVFPFLAVVTAIIILL